MPQSLAYTPIQIYSSATTGIAPLAANLTNNTLGSELAINITDGKLFYKDTANVVQVLATKGGVGTSSNTQILYNNSGLIGGSSNLTFNGTTLSVGGESNSGNLSFTGTSNRITGDFSNATFANRAAFQSSTVNSGSRIGALPNGTSTNSSFDAYNNSDPTNAAYGRFGVTGATDVTIQSAVSGTGTYLPLTMYTGGSERLRIDTSGSVLIGRTAKLYAESLSATGYAVFGTSNGTGLVFSGSDGTNGVGGTIDGVPYVLKTSNTERLRIDTSGNVGIGTSSPTAYLSVNVASASNGINVGDFNSGNNTGSIPQIQSLGSRGDGNGTFQGRFGAAYRRFDGTAIATGTGLGTYAFGGQYGTATTYTSANLLYAASINGVSEGSFTGSTAMPTAITFSTGSTGNSLGSVNVFYGTERMRIDSSGNVGIGTSSVNGRLDVLGVDDTAMYFRNATANIRFRPYVTSYTTSQISALNAAGSAYTPLAIGGSYTTIETNGIERMRIDASGNVGIGTSSPASNVKLAVNGTIQIGTGTTSSAGCIFSNSNFGMLFQALQASPALADFSWLNSAGTERMRIDSSGNVGIGGTPTYKLDVIGSAVNTISSVRDTTGYAVFRAANTSGSSLIGVDSSTGSIGGTANSLVVWNNVSTPIQFATNGIERMRIDASGNLLVGTTSATARFVVTAASNSTYAGQIRSDVTGDVAQAPFLIAKYDNNSTTSQVFQRFAINLGGIGSGQINANGASAAAFGSFSDARLKENIEPLPSQLDNILALKPCEFDYKDGSGHQIGFIAQEMQEVYPDVVGEGEDGMLTITGWSKTEARLVKAIQEQKQLINDLTSRIAKLEGK